MGVSDFMAVVVKCWDFLKISITLPGGYTVTFFDLAIFSAVASIVSVLIGRVISDNF